MGNLAFEKELFTNAKTAILFASMVAVLGELLSLRMKTPHSICDKTTVLNEIYIPGRGYSVERNEEDREQRK